MKFFLGTHKACWLGRLDVPLFVSRRTLAPMKTLPRARGPWALDSGGFTELSMHGRWTVSPKEYVAQVRRFAQEIGQLAWAAPQDLMCERKVWRGGVEVGIDMIERTGLSVPTHQLWTVANYNELRYLAPELPIIPVLQGWTMGDYMDHVEMYDKSGHDLGKLPLVGLGTVCRRQNTIRAGIIVREIRGMVPGIKLHGFGVKTTGLEDFGGELESADSLAWSYDARRADPLPGHTHKACNNCAEYAMAWRERLLEKLGREEAA
jgi:hypothetical protein